MFNPRKDAIVEVWKDNLNKFDFIHDHEGIECDSCALIPETIYCCWFYDRKKKRHYLRYECFKCSEKIFKTDGYFQNFLDMLGVTFRCNFPTIDIISKINNEDILLIAKHFILKRNNEIVKAKL